MTNYDPLEREVIVLKAIWNLIDDLVNYTMFERPFNYAGIILMPKTSAHQKLFNILLADFLSKPKAGLFDLPHPSSMSPTDKTYLFYLKHVCANPQLSPQTASCLVDPTEAFANWLEGICLVEKAWFPSVDVEMDVSVKRIEPLKICGNIAKHNFSRLSVDVAIIRDLFQRHGHPIDEGQGYLVIPEFFEWFHKDVLAYQLSEIAEFLNNIRWGIYDYLRPHFEASIQREPSPSPMYSYTVPLECTSELSRTLYWELMNDVRSRPYMPRFSVSQHAKAHF